MKIRRLFSYLLYESLKMIDYRINRFLGYKYTIHIGDLLTKCEGNITGGQYIIASRVLDIEKIYAGDEPYWHTYISSKIYETNITSSDRLIANERFKLLVKSLDMYGFNNGVSNCTVSEKPMVFNNGTHRLAWSVLNEPNAYIECVRCRNDLLPWFPIVGDDFFGVLGKSKLKELEDRYEKILSTEVRTELTAYIVCSDEKIFERELSEYGTIVEKRALNSGDNVDFIYRFLLKKQMLYIKGKTIKSVYVDIIEKRINNKNNRIGHTVTESIAIEIWIMEKRGFVFD